MPPTLRAENWGRLRDVPQMDGKNLFRDRLARNSLVGIRLRDPDFLASLGAREDLEIRIEVDHRFRQLAENGHIVFDLCRAISDLVLQRFFAGLRVIRTAPGKCKALGWCGQSCLTGGWWSN